MTNFVLCSNCFRDQGLRLSAGEIGLAEDSVCSNCGATNGRKLNKGMITSLAHRFFVWGTLQRWDYGAAPAIQFNDQQPTSISASPWFEPDLRLIEKAIDVGFFDYGPRFWMFGEVEPLKELQDPATRGSIINRILAEYPAIALKTEQTFYRVRKAPENPADFDEYDSPPVFLAGSGRLDSKDFSVMYASPDLQICVHECRFGAEDDLFVATLEPTKDLELLDLTELLQEDVTEFDSLDMAIHMLFLAGEHSYIFSREIALAAHEAGYHGLVYPSYFSLLRTGKMPFETTLGISNRRFSQIADREKANSIPNLALFGRPIEQGHVGVRCINKLIINRVEYGIHFGPVGY